MLYEVITVVVADQGAEAEAQLVGQFEVVPDRSGEEQTVVGRFIIVPVNGQRRGQQGVQAGTGIKLGGVVDAVEGIEDVTNAHGNHVVDVEGVVNGGIGFGGLTGTENIIGFQLDVAPVAQGEPVGADINAALKNRLAAAQVPTTPEILVSKPA